MKPILSTRRFDLCEFEPSHRDAFIAYQTDPAFSIFYDENELNTDHLQGVFQLFLDWQESHPRRNYQLAVLLKDANCSLIGSCGIRMDGCAPGEAVFGIELARPYWGRYLYAQEIAEALIRWAFSELDLSALIADTAFENTAVARLAERAGFRRTHVDNKQWWRLERSGTQVSP